MSFRPLSWGTYVIVSLTYKIIFLGSNTGDDNLSISTDGSASMSKKHFFRSNSLRKPSLSPMLKRSTKLKIGDAKDDIHVCIKCLQALMNNKFGFNMVIVHEKAINSVALSLVSNIFPIL